MRLMRYLYLPRTEPACKTGAPAAKGSQVVGDGKGFSYHRPWKITSIGLTEKVVALYLHVPPKLSFPNAHVIAQRVLMLTLPCSFAS